MEYAQLNTDLTGGLQITTHGNVEWDSTHFCPASALTPEEATMFRVVSLTATEQPEFDPLTQTVIRDGCEKLGDVWQYKWRIDALTGEQIAANQAAKAESVQAEVIALTQLRLDAFAKTRNYDGILSACTYATSSVPRFAAEGQAAVDARDATWSTLYTLMGEVLASTRPMPSGFGDVEPLLPALEWPL